jgi:death-on-curing family protein
MSIWLPEAQDVINVHEQLVEMFRYGDDPIEPAGVKNLNLLESACFRPYTHLGDTDKYKTLEEKCAALFHSLVKNHAFHNGNKRTALVSLIITLSKNKRYLRSTINDYKLYQLVIEVAQNTFGGQSLNADQTVDEIARWLRKNTDVIHTKLREMTVDEFVEKCCAYGAKCKDKGGYYVLRYGGIFWGIGANSVNIKRNHKPITGKVASNYLSELGMLSSETGLVINDFNEEINLEREQIRRFIEVYKKLARS